MPLASPAAAAGPQAPRTAAQHTGMAVQSYCCRSARCLSLATVSSSQQPPTWRQLPKHHTPLQGIGHHLPCSRLLCSQLPAITAVIPVADPLLVHLQPAALILAARAVCGPRCHHRRRCPALHRQSGLEGEQLRGNCRLAHRLQPSPLLVQLPFKRRCRLGAPAGLQALARIGGPVCAGEGVGVSGCVCGGGVHVCESAPVVTAAMAVGPSKHIHSSSTGRLRE